MVGVWVYGRVGYGAILARGNIGAEQGSECTECKHTRTQQHHHTHHPLQLRRRPSWTTRRMFEQPPCARIAGPLTR